MNQTYTERAEPPEQPPWTESQLREALGRTEDGQVQEAIVLEFRQLHMSLERREGTILTLRVDNARWVQLFREAMQDLTGLRQAAKEIDQFIAATLKQAGVRPKEDDHVRDAREP